MSEVRRTGPVAAGTWRLPQDAITAAIGGAVEFLIAEVKKRTPVGSTSNLRGSITGQVSMLGDRTEGMVFSGVEYKTCVELGTQPHMPPVEALMNWVRSKLSFQRASPKRKRELRAKAKAAGLPPPRDETEAQIRSIAWAIAMSIKKRGTSFGPRPGDIQPTIPGPTGGRGYGMFELALDENRDKIEKMFFKPLGLALARSAGGGA